MVGYCVKGAARNGCLRDTPRAFWAAIKMAHTVKHIRLPPVARDYLYRTDTVWRGGVLARLRREVFAALPSASWNPAHATDASIRAIISGRRALRPRPRATHSASS